jgi:hypothetical protein
VSNRAALVFALVLSASRTAGAEPCAVRAEVTGDPVAVASVVLELARLGVEQGAPAPGCRGVVAQVELAVEGGLAVAVRDGSRRSEGRVVSDATVAATWIDSWLRDELDGTSWLVATPAVQTKVEPVAIAKPAVASPTRPLVERFSVMAGYEWSYSGQAANGLTIASCVRFGGLCLGGRARYSREDDRPVNLTAMSRSDAAVLATASYALAAGRMQVVPELGLGLGRRATSRVESCTCAPGDPTDPMTGTCPPAPNMPPAPCTDPAGKTFVGDNFATATWTPRLAGTLRIAIPIFDHVWLDGLASLSLAPFGHADPFVRPADVMSADGTAPEQSAIPGEPLTGLHLGVGIRIGAP